MIMGVNGQPNYMVVRLDGLTNGTIGLPPPD
jgi:hypothetical protein